MKICIETDNTEKFSAYTEAERNVNTAEVRASLSGTESGSPRALKIGNQVNNSQTGTRSSRFELGRVALSLSPDT